MFFAKHASKTTISMVNVQKIIQRRSLGEDNISVYVHDNFAICYYFCILFFFLSGERSLISCLPFDEMSASQTNRNQGNGSNNQNHIL